MIASIADLLRPHEPVSLEAAILDRRPLHLKTGRGAEFARLLPWEQFNTLPSTDRLLDGQLRIVRRNRDTMLDMAVTPSGKSGGPRRLSPSAVHGLSDQGMSLAVARVEHLVPAITALAAMLERRFRANVQVNCYASFHDESAFVPHFDDHDVLAMQIHGSKRWFRHGQPYHTPVSGGRFPQVEPPPPVEEELLMEAGDLLYLPRGEVHWAQLEAASSMHLTFGIVPRKGRDLLRWLAGQADAHEVGREDIHALEAPAARAARVERLRAMVHALADSFDLDAFLKAADDERVPLQPFNLGLLHELGDDTLVLPALRRHGPIDERFRPKLGEDERAVLALLLAKEGHRISAIADALPDLDDERARAAVRGLAGKSLVFLFAG